MSIEKVISEKVEAIDQQILHMAHLKNHPKAYRFLSWEEEITRLWNRINEYREAQAEAGIEPCNKKRFTIGGF